MDLKERWFNSYHGIAAAALWDSIEAHYREPHRFYHNLLHLQHCFSELDRIHLDDKSKEIISLAIWFHDICYQPRRYDNKEQSAKIFFDAAKLLSVTSDVSDRVGKFILESKHANFYDKPDWLCRIFLDIDLSILGQSTNVYKEYSEQISKEYSWVPRELFITNRIDLLRKMSSRRNLYHTHTFGIRYEIIARINISTEIAALNSQL